jgi:hypothetical protein
MIFAKVRLPDEIGIALDANRLVVFAGAGISVPPPSNLPLFDGLVRQITGQTGVKQGDEDRSLGRKQRDGTDVHGAAAKILTDPKSRPTELHKQILRVFGTADRVRIVTTNLDNHFRVSKDIVFPGELVPEFHAPALPLGDDFRGIVYLHGSAKVDPQKTVLTDADFGVAYMTRGWAREFLIALFSGYTVLFVGYSHNDVTTTYLARGLRQSRVKPRWTLVSSDLMLTVEENWKHLDIEVQQYPIDPSNTENSHQALTDFFVGWAQHNNQSLLDRAKSIKRVAVGLPPESEQGSEYLNYCLRTPRLAQDLCNSIRQAAWVRWMDDGGHFNRFFEESTTDLGPHEKVIAIWLATFVRRRFPSLLLELIQRHQQRLSLPFARVLGHAVWVDTKKQPDPNFSTWISVLLAQGERSLPLESWAYLLQKCQIPQHRGVALRLFELLSTPQVRLGENLTAGELSSESGQRDPLRTIRRASTFEIEWPTDSRSWLTKAWSNIFKPTLAVLADPLGMLATKQLTAAYLLLQGARKGSDSYDRLGWSRSSIAPHEQNRATKTDCLFLLIDIARDVVMLWFKIRPARARAQIEMWWCADLPLLRRLAVYGVGIDPDRSADERIEWLLANDLIFRSGMKKEVFDILALDYRPASKAIRGKLLRRIEQGFRGKLPSRMTPEIAAYAQFNLLIWLRRADGKCPLLAKALSEIKKSYPLFRERAHPEFDVWRGKSGFVDTNEGFDFDGILSELPGVYLDNLQRADEHSARKDRWAYLNNLSVLFARNRAWGQAFMEALGDRDEADMSIWNGVFNAWREALKTEVDWAWILDVAHDLPQSSAAFAGAASLVSRIWQLDLKLHDDTVAKAATLMDKAWKLCCKVEDLPDETYRDWLSSAINHEGGCIGEFWVHYCSHIRARAGSRWKGIPKVMKANMREALQGSSRVKVYARIAMTPWMDHIYAWDKRFAIEQFLPLLDWDRDAVVAQQTWSVLLNYRHAPSFQMEKLLLPYYRQCTDRLTTMLKDSTEKSDQFDENALWNLGHYLASWAMQLIQNPLKSGFFQDFLPCLPDKPREALAQGILECLQSLQAEKVTRVWRNWLGEYFDLRLVGVPVALSPNEANAMANWGLELGPVFPEAVERITRLPLKGVVGLPIFQTLLKGRLVRDFPIECCRYINAIMKGEEYPFLNDELLGLHQVLKRKICARPEFKELEKLLYLCGWSG